MVHALSRIEEEGKTHEVQSQCNDQQPPILGRPIVDSTNPILAKNNQHHIFDPCI